MAAINFCTNETSIDVNKRKIELSRIFLWYKKDFICQTDLENRKTNKDDELLIR